MRATIMVHLTMMEPKIIMVPLVAVPEAVAVVGLGTVKIL